MDEKSSEWLNYGDVERLFQIKRSTAAWLVHMKKIPHVRLGARTVRFNRGELEAWFAERSVAVKGGQND